MFVVAVRAGNSGDSPMLPSVAACRSCVCRERLLGAI